MGEVIYKISWFYHCMVSKYVDITVLYLVVWFYNKWACYVVGFDYSLSSEESKSSPSRSIIRSVIRSLT